MRDGKGGSGGIAAPFTSNVAALEAAIPPKTNAVSGGADATDPKSLGSAALAAVLSRAAG